MSDQKLRFSLGNVSKSGILMKDEGFAHIQEKKKQHFIRFLQSDGFPHFEIVKEEMLNDGYRLTIKYKGDSVDIRHRDQIRKHWSDVKIRTHKDADEFYIPFTLANRRSNRCVDCLIILIILFIMIMCIYIQILNKPCRYGFLLPNHVYSQERTRG